MSTANLSDKERQNLRETFDLFDIDKNGTIDIDELQKMINKLQHRAISLEEAQALMKKVDINGNGTLSFEEFCELFTMITPGDPDAEIKRAFDVIDTDQSGSLDFEELKVLFTNLGIEAPDDKLRDIFDIFDTDQSGDIDFDEFKVIYEQYGVQGLTVEEIKLKNIKINKKQHCCSIF